MSELKAADFEHLVAEYAAAKGMTVEAVRAKLTEYDEWKRGNRPLGRPDGRSNG